MNMNIIFKGIIFSEKGDGKVVIILDKKQLIQIFYSCNLIDDILKIEFESSSLIYSFCPHCHCLKDY